MILTPLSLDMFDYELQMQMLGFEPSPTIKTKPSDLAWHLYTKPSDLAFTDAK